jgi:exodeoxyribonuclease V beta subunit
VKQADDDDLLADLRGLVEDARHSEFGAAVEVVEVETAPIPRYQPRGIAPHPTAALVARRAINSQWRATSFSALTAGPEGLSAPATEGLDHEEETAGAVNTSASAPPDETERPVLLDAFPRGAGPGNALHGVLEEIDFTESDSGAVREICVKQLERFGLDLVHADALTAGIREVVETRLTEGGPCLSQVPRRSRISEMEFTLPIALPVGPDASSTAGYGRSLSPRRLAEVFARHASVAVPKDYASRIAALRFDSLTGYMRGFIDLVFVHEGRWYVVDYKSNYLGVLPGDYALERLTEAMTEHHYVLQYHLYTAALHRHLLQRLPGYDYDRDFGGVYYLFARGMSAERGPVTGVFTDCPQRAMIGALLDVLDGTVLARTG